MWNRVEIKKNFDSLVIKVDDVEKQLTVNDLKKLTLGKGNWQSFIHSETETFCLQIFSINKSFIAYCSFLTGFKGCIRKLLFDGKLSEQTTDRLSGSAQLGSCPRQ